MPPGSAFDAWQAHAVIRLLVAAALGAAIGLEREHHGRSAGLRTQLLVALGSATAMVVSLYFAAVFGPAGGAVRVDPARVAYGVMGGVGFLGAGAIIHYGAGVRGLTTAASLWCSAAIGLAAGFGMFLVAGVATAIVLFALKVLDLADRVIPVRAPRRIAVTVGDTAPDAVERYEAILRQAGAKVVNVDYAADLPARRATITFAVSIRADGVREILRRLADAAPDTVRIDVQ